MCAAAAIAALAAPGASHAAAEATLTPDGPAHEWRGGPGDGLPVSFAFDQAGYAEPWERTAWHGCDETLLKVGETGDFRLAVAGAPGAVDVPDPEFDCDIDVYVFESDASGTAGTRVSYDTGATASTNEEVRLRDLAPGHYLVRVVFYQGMRATYSARAGLEAVRR